MPDSLVLTPFQPQQAPLIASWVTSATDAAYWASTRWPIDAGAFARWHADPEIQPYVLFDDAIAVGYGEVWFDTQEQEVELGRLLIATQRRGQGLGGRLVELLLAQAAQSGVPDAFVRVVAENTAALRCYRRSGFVEVAPAAQERYNQGQPVAYRWLWRRLYVAR